MTDIIDALLQEKMIVEQGISQLESSILSLSEDLDAHTEELDRIDSILSIEVQSY